MSRLPYHRSNHHDALQGTLAFDNDLFGAYFRIIFLIYDNSGPIPHDDVWLAGVMRCSARKVRAHIAQLVKLNKISIKDGLISNRRCEKEIKYLSKFFRNQRERGSKGGRKRAEKIANSTPQSKEINDVAVAAAQAEVQVRLKPTESSSTETDSTLIDDGDGQARASPPSVVWDQRLIQAKSAFGRALNLSQPNANHYRDLRELCEPAAGPPCDWDHDVVPALEKVGASYARGDKLVSSFRVIRTEAIANRDRRLAGLPDPKHPTATEATHGAPKTPSRNRRGPASVTETASQLVGGYARCERADDAEFELVGSQSPDSEPTRVRLIGAG